MSEKKLFTPKEAAIAVLNKAKEILQETSLAKAEYPTENNPKPGVKYGKTEKDQKALERDYNEYEVKKPNFKDSDGKRLERQVSPSQNPREEAEGNNKDGGMEPEYEFKDKVSKELAKEKASHMVKSQSGMHTVVYKSAGFEKSEGENDLKKAKNPYRASANRGKQESSHMREQKGVHKPVSIDLKTGESYAGHDVKSARALEENPYSSSSLGSAEHRAQKYKESAKEEHKRVLGEMKQMPKPDLGKSENPDEKEDAELGEQVEKDVEQHHKDTGNEVDKEGHDLMAKPEDKSEGQTEHASTSAIPRLVLSAKLSKFMEHMHSKRKNAQAQSAEAVGHDATNAPAPGSSQAGQPDSSRPKTQPTKGDMNKAESNFDKLKHKIEDKEGYSEKGAAGAAYEAGKAKYGKAGMAAKAAAGRKK